MLHLPAVVQLSPFSHPVRTARCPPMRECLLRGPGQPLCVVWCGRVTCAVQDVPQLMSTFHQVHESYVEMPLANIEDLASQVLGGVCDPTMPTLLLAEKGGGGSNHRGTCRAPLREARAK